VFYKKRLSCFFLVFGLYACSDSSSIKNGSIDEYNESGVLKGKTTYIVGVKVAKDFYSPDGRVVLSERYTDKGYVFEQNDFYVDGSKKRSVTYDIYQLPKKKLVAEYSWDEYGNPLDNWFSAQQTAIETKQSNFRHAQKVQEPVLSIYSIDHSWSEDRTRKLYKDLGGYCTSRETSYIDGNVNIQLACKKHVSSNNKYYYFENGVMTTIQK